VSISTRRTLFQVWPFRSRTPNVRAVVSTRRSSSSFGRGSCWPGASAGGCLVGAVVVAPGCGRGWAVPGLTGRAVWWPCGHCASRAARSEPGSTPGPHAQSPRLRPLCHWQCRPGEPPRSGGTATVANSEGSGRARARPNRNAVLAATAGRRAERLGAPIRLGVYASPRNQSSRLVGGVRASSAARATTRQHGHGPAVLAVCWMTPRAVRYRFRSARTIRSAAAPCPAERSCCMMSMISRRTASSRSTRCGGRSGRVKRTANGGSSEPPESGERAGRGVTSGSPAAACNRLTVSKEHAH